MKMVQSGMMKRAEEAAFVTEMKKYQEQVEMKVAQNLWKENSDENTIINVGLEDQESITTILPDILSKYVDQVIVQENIMYYKYNGTSVSEERVRICFKYHIPVWGFENPDDFEKNKDEIEGEPGSKGEYTKTGNTYCCAPDLTRI